MRIGLVAAETLRPVGKPENIIQELFLGRFPGPSDLSGGCNCRVAVRYGLRFYFCTEGMEP